jgi:hypothetical protein
LRMPSTQTPEDRCHYCAYLQTTILKHVSACLEDYTHKRHWPSSAMNSGPFNGVGRTLTIPEQEERINITTEWGECEVTLSGKWPVTSRDICTQHAEQAYG